MELLLLILFITVTVLLLGISSFWTYKRLSNPYRKVSEEDLFSLLKNAVINEDIETTSRILELKRIKNLDAHTVKSTLLSIACRSGCLPIAKMLIASGASIDGRTPKGDTPLICASRNGHLDCLELLLDGGSIVDGRGHRGWTALHWASINGRYEIAEMLIGFGADINLTTYDGGTCVYYACLSGHSELAKDLLAYGANIHTVDKNGDTPMHAAARQNGSSLSVILKHNPDYLRNSAGETPIDTALLRGHRKFVHSLLLNKPELQTNFYKEALELALTKTSSMRDYDQILKCLTEMSVMSQEHFSSTIAVLSTFLIDIGRKIFENSRKSSLKCQIENSTQNDNPQIQSISKLNPQSDSSLSSSQSDTFVEDFTPIDSSSYNNTNSNDQNGENGENNQNLDNSPLLKPSSEICPLLSFKHLSNSFVLIIYDVLHSRSTFDQSRRNEVNHTVINVIKKLNILWVELERAIQELVSTEKIQPTQSFSSNILDQLFLLSPLIDKYYSISMIEQKIVTPQVDPAGILVDLEDSNSIETIPTNKLINKEFVSFVARNYQAFRSIIDHDPNILTSHFHFIMDFPTVFVDEKNGTEITFHDLISKLSFEQKCTWFRMKIESEQTSASVGSKITAERGESNILSSCMESVLSDSPENLRGKLLVKFAGELGYGAGVQREFFVEIVKAILSSSNRMFRLIGSKNMYHPIADACIHESKKCIIEKQYRFFGRILGMALVHDEHIPVHFSPIVYNALLGRSSNSLEDIKSLDPSISQCLEWIIQNHNTDSLGLNFTLVETDPESGKPIIVELKEGGDSIELNDFNKLEYVDRVLKYYGYDPAYSDLPEYGLSSCNLSLTALRSGFYDIVEKRFIAPFKESEFGELFSGLDTIDLQDWMKNTTYNNGFSAENEQCKWFWQWMSTKKYETHKQMLQFVTGSSTLPLGGFQNLRGVNSIVKFCIHICNDEPTSNLPSASTCYNRLKIPRYTSYEELVTRFETVLTFGILGFEFH